jgi:hypothetical protein
MSDSGAAPTPTPKGIDPRGPRFVAGITAVLLAVATVLGLTGLSTARVGFVAVAPGSAATFVPGAWGDIDVAFVAGREPWLLPLTGPLPRVLDPGFLLLLVIALLFLWGVLSARTAPWAVLYRTLVQPRLSPPTELEDPRPPRFAQGVGLVVTGVGLILHVIGVPWALPIAAGLAFIAAFLNAVFGLCLGCQLYLLLQRIGVLGRRRPATA